MSHFDLFGAVDLNFFSPNDPSGIYFLANQYNLPDTFVVGGHGNSEGVYQNDVVLPVAVLEGMIRAHNKFNGNIPVVLASCEVGLGNYAQELANRLNVKVYAPDSLAIYTTEISAYGFPITNVTYWHAKPETNEPDRGSPGKLILFKPE